MSHAEVNGVSLYYEEHGSGEPLVLLHGGLGAGAMFEAIMPALCAGRRVITVDLQGHGGTADVDRPLRPETMADDVAALIEHLGLPAADVMGYSLGGLGGAAHGDPAPAARAPPGPRLDRLPARRLAPRGRGEHGPLLARDGRHAGAVPALRALRAPGAPRGGLAGADRQDERDAQGRLRLDGRGRGARDADHARLRRRGLRCAPRTSSSSTACWAAACATPTGTGRCARPRAWRSCPGPRTTTSTRRPRWRPRSRAFLDADAL